MGAGIPDSSEEDACVAQELGVSWESVLKNEEDGSHTLINSAEVHTSKCTMSQTNQPQTHCFTVH